MHTLLKTAAVVAVAGALSVGAGAQQKPNFSGRWEVVSPEKGAGTIQVVKHDDKTLATEHGSEGPGHRMIYQLDGVERRNALPSHGSEIVILSTARWEGDRVVITSRASYPNGMKTQSREVWSLDAQGRLVIDYTESGPGGSPGPTMKVIHVKKS
jgi:hypothetical protein